MAGTIELAGLEDRLERDSGEGESATTAILLLVFVLADAVAALYGRGVILPAFAAAFSLHEGEALLAWLTAATHVLLVILGYTRLARARLVVGEYPEADLIHAASRGTGIGAAGVAWLAVMIPSLLILTILVMAAPVPMSRSSGLLALIAILACPIALAGLLSRGWLARQLLQNSAILLGAALGFAIAIGGTIIIDPVAEIATEPGGGWIALLECAILCVIPAVLATGLLPGQRQIYTVTVNRADDAPPIVQFNSFRFVSRAPRYLTFSVSQGQLLVLTREREGSSWTLFDAANSQRELHLHNCEVQIWNLTRVSRLLTDQIVVQDGDRNFELTLTIGQLPVSAKLEPGSRFTANAIAAANNILFQNPDLAGLLTRAAKRALRRALDGSSSGHEGLAIRLAEIDTFLGTAPTSTSVLQGIDLGAHLRPTDLSAARLDAAREAGRRFLGGLQIRREGLSAIIQAANQAVQSLDEDLLSEVTAEVSRRGNAGADQRAVDTRRVTQLLDLIGLRITDAQVTAVGKAAECETRMEAARAEVAKMVDAALTTHEGTVNTLDAQIAQMELHVVRPGALPRRYEEGIVGKRLAQQTPLPPPSPTPSVPAPPDSAAPQPEPSAPESDVDDEPLN